MEQWNMTVIKTLRAICMNNLQRQLMIRHKNGASNSNSSRDKSARPFPALSSFQLLLV